MSNTKKIKACFAKASTHKKGFEGKICAMPISVGQPYHESEKMLATTKLVSKYFAKCTVIVCDSLQRHSLYHSKNEFAAYKDAINAGNQWIERNTRFFEQFNIPYELVRWDKWYKNESFSSYLKKIEDLSCTDNHFMSTINDCAASFVNQHLIHYDETIFSRSVDVAKEVCKKYLKEEAAVLLMWHDHEQYDFLAYPGDNNKVIHTIYEYFIKNNKETNKLISLKIKFK